MSTRTVFVLAGIIVALLAGWVVFGPESSETWLFGDAVDESLVTPEVTTLTLGSALILAETVRDTKDLKKGLGGRESINSNEGLLLSFEKDSEWGIWMKDMKFALDILWLSSNFEVVHMEEFVTPETYPQIFVPQAPSRHVLEVKAGSISRFGVLEGDRLK